jgi:SAM-dependent methyltransferase
MSARVIEAEWLDALPAEDPRAIRSRADLRRVNWFMNNPNIVAQVLRRAAPQRVLDLGAGDGSFAARVANLCDWRDVDCVLLDQCPCVPAAVRRQFQAVRCRPSLVRCDALNGLTATGDFDVIFSNLFLHHFTSASLKQLLAFVAERCRVFVACEPRRSLTGLFATRLLGLIGCNAVTRHDALMSVRAGFRGTELTEHWPRNPYWSIEERPAGMFSHLFVARKV